jgi:signal transduction histidine kinase
LKLQLKLILYNAISKVIIISAIGALLPVLIQTVVYNHIDKRLTARLDKTMLMVSRGGLDEIALDQDCSFDSYNIFKEEFVSISPLPTLPQDFGKAHVENTERIIENEIIHHRVLTQAFIYDNQLYEIEIGEGLSAVDQLNLTIRKFSLWMMIGVILFSIFLDLAFARLLLRPFNKMVNQKLRNIDHPATFDPTPVKTSTFEFAYLDKTLNEMMAKIKETFEMEREFIMNVSHEILTPISILKNRLENIINDSAVPDSIAEKMVESQKTLSRLTKVVKSLLYISKIENEQFARNETADIRTLVIEILEELEDWINDKGITIINEWNGDFVMRNCNKSLLHTMIFNILSNAVKYNSPNGKIFINGITTDAEFVLTIRDTGNGIAKEQLPFIFERFRRFRPEDEMSYGLGLPIVKSVADFHTIKIQAESTVGMGTEFKLTFPPAGHN